MACRLVSKVCFGQRFVKKFVFNQCLVCQKAYISTQPNIDINDLSSKDALSSWKLCAAVCLVC